jgi:endoglucanase
MFNFLKYILFLPLVFGAEWKTQGHKIYRNNEVYTLKGVNWFGYDNGCNLVNGLWEHNMVWYLDFIRSNNFNTLRIPFSYETAMNLDAKQSAYCLGNEKFWNIKDSLDYLFVESKKRDINILMDFHRIHDDINEKPLDILTMDQFMTAWSNIIDVAIKYDNFMGIDIKNEPHGKTTLSQWAVIVNRMMYLINKKYPEFDGLFFIEGTQGVDFSGVWGGSLNGLRKGMIEVNNKVVFSPHTYGSTELNFNVDFGEDYFHKHFGFLLEMYDSAIVIGETGGNFNKENGDFDYFQRLSSYLNKIGQTNIFFWSISPNSENIGGLLTDNWTTPEYEKLKWIEQLIPNPTFPIKRNLRKRQFFYLD